MRLGVFPGRETGGSVPTCVRGVGNVPLRKGLVPNAHVLCLVEALGGYSRVLGFDLGHKLTYTCKAWILT